MLIYENIDTQSEDFKIYLLITKHSFESFMCLDLVLERQQSFLFQIFAKYKTRNTKTCPKY